ncbi:MAG: phosphopantetheine-binding protein [Thermoanaerobaculia bacterium]|nr:phosphopantetheine-binding protein [Thermoanaerobaculia bacterium]
MADDVHEIEDRILAYVRAELLASGETVGREDDLLSELLDSVAVLRLAGFVDQEFGLTTRPQDFVVENFESAASIARYIRRSHTARQGG